MSLSDLIPRQRPAAPSILEADNGMRAEMQRCDRHGIDYTVTFIPSFDCWTGECQECAKDRELATEAHQIAATRTADLAKRLEAELAKHQGEIAKDVDERIRKQRPEIERQVKAVWAERLGIGMRAALEAEIMEELRTKGGL